MVAATLAYAPAMQEPAAASPSSAAASFAGLLAALTAPPQKPPPASDQDDFADDIVTLSYEQALRTHARYRHPQPDDETYKEMNQAVPDPEPEGPIKSLLGERRKSSSITIRLSQAESAQLHARAAEAGLTVSAYLRSCTLEVEALRAQVKEVLAQLRPSASANQEAASGKTPSSTATWRSRFFPRWTTHRRTSRA